ncbi:hypothetical protein H5410_060304 [Solanum commersonii]|uniref:Uncharacterized protein n=1 Tax=Solanum commersonii TaxID=4109 RepID=A0A9J5W4V4_SOLCO|nr:hypothetical protein H5410_060304 [Solanum commersonii]
MSITSFFMKEADLLAFTFHLDELCYTLDEKVLKVSIVSLYVLVTISDNATVHAIGSWANATNEEALLGWDKWYWNRFDTYKHHHIVKCREICNKVREDGWNSCCQFRVYQPYPWHTNDTKAGAQAKEPFQWNFIVKIKVVLLASSIVPDKHDSQEGKREHKGDPSSLWNLNECRRQVDTFDEPE